MLKQRIIRVIIGLALLAAVTSSSEIVADSLGLSPTSQAHACVPNGDSGGGC